MSDDLVKRLRAVDHLDIEDCFMQSPLYAYAADLIEALTSEVGELQEVFDFQWRANMLAVEMWRTANPGNDLVLPDSAKLTVWLLERIEALNAERDFFEEEWVSAVDKLNKAVEALRFYAKGSWSALDEDLDEDGSPGKNARALLAEIEGSTSEGEKG